MNRQNWDRPEKDQQRRETRFSSAPLSFGQKPATPQSPERSGQGPRHLGGRNRKREHTQTAEYAEYFAELVEREWHLARLLGWQDLSIQKASNPRFTLIEGIPPDGAFRVPLPQWAREPAAAWGLMSQTNCSPVVDGDIVRVVGADDATMVRLSDHPNKDQAMQLAVVEGAIAKFELEINHSRPTRSAAPSMG